MPRALVTSAALQHVMGEYTRILTEAGFEIVFLNAGGDQISEAELIVALQRIDATVAGSEPYTRRVLNECPTLSVISRTGVGYDAVDVEAASERGIAVGITPGANHESVAEQTFALLLAVAKQVVQNHNMIQAGRYDRHITVPLRKKTLGIVGLGRAGRAVSLRALAFGMKVIAFDPFANALAAETLGLPLVDWPTLLSSSDVLSLHAPMTSETRNLINADSIALMKDGVILVNTARGGLVDEEALAAALITGKVRGVGLDVTFREPPIGSPLLHAPNVVLAPHLAGIDAEAIEQMAIMAARTIVDLYQGRYPEERLVNAEALRGRFAWK